MGDLEKKYQAPAWIMIKPWMAGLLTFLLLSSLSLYIISQRFNIQKSEEKQAAKNIAELAAGKLQQSLQYGQSAAKALTLTIDKNGVPRNFDSVAAYILKTSKYIDALELAPRGIISYVYPLQGEEEALHYNILGDSLGSKEAIKAVQKKEMFFAGPLQLKEGGIGVVGRLPVFRNDTLWGFSAVVMRLPTLLLAGDIDTTGQTGYYYQFSKINPNTGKEEFFLPIKVFSTSQYKKVMVSIPSGEWNLSVVPVNGYSSLMDIIPLCMLAFILSLIGSFFAVYASETPVKLQKLVKERTTELEKTAMEAKNAEEKIRHSETKYRTLVEQASDGIFIATFEGNFLVVNPAGCKLSQYTEEELLKMRFHDLALSSELKVKPFRLDEVAAGKTTTYERKMRRKDGKILDVEVRAKIIAPDRFLAFIRDISDRKKVELELVKSREDLRELSNYIENVREEERLNISREIHDELGQQLTVLKMNVSRLGKKISSKEESFMPEISEILTSINEMVETVRKISSELRPGMLDDLGLIAAMDWYCEEFDKRTGIRTVFINGLNDDKFSKKVSISLFRIIQESLTNVARHAEARKADISLMRQDQQLVLLIEDDGKGFDPSVVEHSTTLGILGMKERARMIGGTYNVFSTPGKGTVIEVVVPFTSPELIETASRL